MRKTHLLPFALGMALITASPTYAQDFENAAFVTFTQGDYAEALRLNEPGLAQGSADAFWLLGLMHASVASVDRDNALAVKYLNSGVDAGATYGLTLIGNIYQEGGYGVDQDIIKAAEFYRRGSDEGYADAQ